MIYDYLVVGAGLYGATFAREMLDSGKKVLIIDKRNHSAGNCYTEQKHGIHVHKFGPHQAKAKSKKAWDFFNRFAEFNHYRAHIKASYDNKLYSMPPNMNLFNQLWGVVTPSEAEKILEETRIPCRNPQNLRDFVLDAVGTEVYEKFYYGYSKKQWGKCPSLIPVTVGKRLPIRLVYNDRYFDCEYEGIPIGGYTKMIENMFDGADLELNVDYTENRQDLNKRAKKVLYTGKIDEFFDYCYGDLEYRSLRFEEQVLKGDYQGNSIINYTKEDVPYTRIVEHKHFEFKKTDVTIITKEFPANCSRKDVPYYPVKDAENLGLFKKYKEKTRDLPNMLFGGRLADFSYYDMDMTVLAAMTIAKRELNGN